MREAQEIYISNPLPAALAHYEMQLRSILAEAGYAQPRQLETVSVEGIPTKAKKLLGMFNEIWKRVRSSREVNQSTILVLWPAFGYFDFVTWWLHARTNRVCLFIHDPKPLRKQYGHSPLAHQIFRWLIARSRVEIVCHTELAAAHVREFAEIEPSIIPLPILEPTASKSPPDRFVRVLGQYKDARRIEALIDVAAACKDLGVRFETVGRGWPKVEGWSQVDRFVEEDEFQEFIERSECVLLPYDRFYQSAVATRCLESLVPIVGPMHEQMLQLFGVEWPGLVASETEWPAALKRVLESSGSADLSTLARNYRKVTVEGWSAWVNPQ